MGDPSDRIRRLVGRVSGHATAAVVLAPAWSNSPWRGTYTSVWSGVISIDLAGDVVATDPRGTVNAGLMTLFFLAARLEATRELDQRGAPVPAPFLDQHGDRAAVRAGQRRRARPGTQRRSEVADHLEDRAGVRGSRPDYPARTQRPEACRPAAPRERWPRRRRGFPSACRPGAIYRSAHGLGLDLDRLVADLDDDAHAPHIAADGRSAEASGAAGTPAFFSDGPRWSEPAGQEALGGAVAERLGHEGPAQLSDIASATQVVAAR